jgi:catechol 2,3-dioxygenase-like lactoylglutathione lyase family enzyme
MLEYGLYVQDVSRSSAFYQDLFGFPVLVSQERIAALDVGSQQVLLLFKQGASSEPMTVPEGGVLPPHDGEGTSHFAFAIEESDLQQWKLWLREHDVEVESEIQWERGGRSLYFRDPDGHLLEIATPGVWETY